MVGPLVVVLIVVTAVGSAASPVITPVWLATCQTARGFNMHWAAQGGSGGDVLQLTAHPGYCLAVDANQSALCSPHATVGLAVVTVPCNTSSTLQQWSRSGAGEWVVAASPTCGDGSATCRCLSTATPPTPGATLVAVPCRSDTGSAAWTLNATSRWLQPANAPQLCARSATPEPSAAVDQLVFEDHFDGDTLNTSVWQVLQQIHRGGVYTRDNVRVADGLLQLTSVPFASPVPINGRVWYMSSGAVNTSNLVERTFGKWLVRARLPNVKYTTGWTGHNSFWLYNAGHQEVDVFEQTAHPGAVGNESTAAGNVHAWECASYDQCPTAECTKVCSGDACVAGGQYAKVADWSVDFHTFGIEWRPDALTWTVDGVVTNTITNTTVIATYSRPMFMALTACVMVDTPPQPGNVFPQRFDIDWVQVYA